MSSAGALRTQGNEKFRGKQYFEAYRCYLAAAEKCSPKDTAQLALIYACLSQTELILEKTQEAIESATKAIENDPSNYKGFLRRGNAYCETLRLQEAFEDYSKALQLEPTDTFLKQRIELTQQQLNQSNTSSPPSSPQRQSSPPSSSSSPSGPSSSASRYGREQPTRDFPPSTNSRTSASRDSPYGRDPYGRSSNTNNNNNNNNNTNRGAYGRDTYGNNTNTYGRDTYGRDTYGNNTTTYGRDTYGRDSPGSNAITTTTTTTTGYGKDSTNYGKNAYGSGRDSSTSGGRRPQETFVVSSPDRRGGFNDTGVPQRSFNDTLVPPSVPDPVQPARKSSLNDPKSTPSLSTTTNATASAVGFGKYTLSYNMDLMQNLMKDKRPPQSEIQTMVDNVSEMMKKEPNIVPLNIKGIFHIVGDTHGQYQDVLSIFEDNGYPSASNPYLFNGDFVDRGSMGVEILIALLAWKLMDPNCIFFNRGNHETRAMNSMYGFEKECTTKYNRGMYESFAEFFNTLPIGHVLNGKVLVVHGGLSDSSMTIDKVNAANRFCQPPDKGIINDVLWADPMDSPGLAPSPRGVTRTFGPDVTQKVLASNGLLYLVRSHQVQENGYLVQHNRKCITVFSAPNYIGSMLNKGALCNFIFGDDGGIKEGPIYQTFSAKPIPRNYPPMKFSPFGGMF